MPEVPLQEAPKLSPGEAAAESAELYETENRAQDTVNDMEAYYDAHGFPNTGSEVSAYQSAQDAVEVTQEVSNQFGQDNSEALHEAAIQEAAERVADVYDNQEVPVTDSSEGLTLEDTADDGDKLEQERLT